MAFRSGLTFLTTDHKTHMKITMSKFTAIAAAAVAALICSQARATTITWTFLENGSNVNLGPTSTFTEMGYSISAFGFANGAPSTPADLFAKWTSGNPHETGLGLVRDAGSDHEIDTHHFVQLDSHISPPATIGGIGLGSIQLHENAAVYGSNTLGVLGTWITTLTADGTFDLSPWAGKFRYFGVTDVGTTPDANTLITSLSATVSAPDGGTTALLLGLGLLGVGALARRFRIG